MAKEILVFIGYSSDAKNEVEAIRSLEPNIQIHLRRILKNRQSRVSSIKMFTWEKDSNIGIGGQNHAVKPYLKTTDIAIFIFKEKIGDVTWEELEYCRQKGIPLIAAFPSRPPNIEKFNDQKYVEEWSELLKKRDSLVKDWNKENSRSITPVDPYTDINHLVSILNERLLDTLPDLILKHDTDSEFLIAQNNLSITENFVTLNSVSQVREFSEKIVDKYRYLLRNEANSISSSKMDNNAFLHSIGCLRENFLTYTGILLFVDKPSIYLPSAIIRATKYEGKTKTSSRIRKMFDGPIFDQILESRQFIEDNIESRDSISNYSSKSEKIFRYPMKCIREILANAICHRDYKEGERAVYTRIFSDRIEISNPGGWASREIKEDTSISLIDLVGEPVERNLSLAKAVSAIDMMEIEGSGLETAVQDCKTINSPIPIVKNKDGYITVSIFPRKHWGKFVGDLLVNSASHDDAIKFHIKYITNWTKQISFQGMSKFKDLAETYVETGFYSVPVKSNTETSRIVVKSSSLFDNLNNINVGIIILGQAGIGKTTLLKKIAHSIINKSNKKVKFKIPLLINLREISPNSSGDNDLILYSKLADILGLSFDIDGLSINLNEENILDKKQTLQLKNSIGEFLDKLNALIILDGFDELVNLQIKQSFLANLQELSQLLSISKFIVASRPSDFSLNINGFSVFEIAGFSPVQQVEYATKWFKNNDVAKQFINIIRKSPYSDLTQTPLIFAQLMAIYEHIGSIPDKPKTIYKKIVLLLLEEWDEQRNIKRFSRYGNFEIDRKFEFLCALAYNLTVNYRKRIYSKNELEQSYRSIADNFNLPRSEAKVVVNELENTTGLFVQTSYNSFGFSHKSIQEYLVAEYLCRFPNFKNLEISILPNELAIATGLSVNSNLFLNQLILREYPQSITIEQSFSKDLLSRLIFENIDFQNNDINLAISILFLASEATLYQLKNSLEHDHQSTFGNKYLDNLDFQRILKIYNLISDLKEIKNTFSYIKDETLKKYSLLKLSQQKTNNKYIYPTSILIENYYLNKLKPSP